MSAAEPNGLTDTGDAPGDRTDKSRALPQPGRNALAYLWGRIFRLWARRFATVQASDAPADDCHPTDASDTPAQPVYFVTTADLGLAVLLTGDRAVVCIKPGFANDPLAAFIKGCGARVWRQTDLELEISPKKHDVVLLPIVETGTADPAYRMAQALLVAARLERPAAMLTIEIDKAVKISTSGLFAWHMPLAPARLQHGRTTDPLATAGARLVASNFLAGPNRPAAKRPASPDRPEKPLALRLYSGAMRVLEPALALYLTLRAKRGKEIWDRLSERRGVATITRQPGRLGWIHAASVGESVSILPLVNRLLSQGHADRILVTTGTVTSAALMDLRLPDGAQHQFAPLDVPRYVGNFLDFWQPDFALFTESEIWPNLLHGLSAREIPHALLNGRISTTSFGRWQRWPGVARATLQSWSVCLAQTTEYANRYAALGVPIVAHTGNLKFDSPPQPADPAMLDALRRDMQGRPVWLAASTHPGEEEIIAQTHYTLRERHPELLTIIVPRHPERAPDIIRLLEDRWLTTARRSLGGKISAKIDVYVADTIGELGLFFRLVEISLIAGSLTQDGGGHNPVEAAQLDNAILHGPGVGNFRDMYEAFDANGGAALITSASDLTGQLEALLMDREKIAAMTSANQTLVRANTGSLERSLAALRPVIGASR